MGREKGDTIIEVVIAVAVFSLAAVSTIALLNQGVAISQRSLEKSLVRQQIDSQAEILRYLAMTGDAAWSTVTSNLSTAPDGLSQSACPSLSALNGNKSFYVTKSSSGAFKVNTIANTFPDSYAAATTYAKIDYSPTAPKAYGIWVQAAIAEESRVMPKKAYDFYIHACWDSVGLALPMTTGTIVRIYGQ